MPVDVNRKRLQLAQNLCDNAEINPILLINFLLDNNVLDLQIHLFVLKLHIFTNYSF